MKAKLYVLATEMEIRLANDELHVPKKKETKEAFIARVKEIVNTEHLDDEFNLIEIDQSIVATNDDTTLTAALVSAEGIQKKLIELVLSERKVAPKKEKKQTVTAISIEEAKASQEYKDAEANIGKYVSFSPAKSIEVFEGKLAGVALNKTNTILYYTVVEASGKRRCCGVKNETVKFIDAPKEEAKPAKETKTKAAKAKKETVAAETNNDSPAAPGADLF